MKPTRVLAWVVVGVIAFGGAIMTWVFIQESQRERFRQQIEIAERLHKRGMNVRWKDKCIVAIVSTEPGLDANQAVDEITQLPNCEELIWPYPGLSDGALDHIALIPQLRRLPVLFPLEANTDKLLSSKHAAEIAERLRGKTVDWMWLGDDGRVIMPGYE